MCICVDDMKHSAAFYARLGFQLVAGPIGPRPVAILSHPLAWKSSDPQCAHGCWGQGPDGRAGKTGGHHPLHPALQRSGHRAQ
ncbi:MULTISPECIES: hypothetical protein [unclassified Synechococcus]|uniref:hypothetical protein n=1 Tax=unclassified Synechococcus TaxID=2626047 RepID=UPI0037D9AF4C